MPHLTQSFFALTLATACLSLSTTLCADSAITPINPGKKASGVQEKRAQMQTMKPRQLDGFTDQRFTVGSWEKKFSPLGSRRSLGVKTGQQGDKVSEHRTFRLPQLMGFDKVEEKTTSPLGQASSELFSPESANEPEKSLRFDDPPLLVIDLQATTFRQQMEDLSMQDINRYQFRRNRSNEPGIAVTEAASGEDSP